MEWPNLRDIAEGPALASHRIRRGLVFRSAAFSHLPGRFVRDSLRGRGIRRIVDLRMPEELDGNDHDLTEICERRHLPLFETVPEEWGEPTDRTPEATADRYLQMAEIGGAPLVEICEVIASGDERPTLIHCVAGRDRTGIVIAVILDLLQVDDEAIVEDYALSRVMDEADGASADPRNIQLFLEKVRQKYGSTARMVRHFGASKDLSSRLREVLVEDE